MFIRCFVDLAMPYGLAEEQLMAAPQEWLPALVVQADADGERLLANVGFGHGMRIERRVEVMVGAPLHFPSRLVLPLSWNAARAEGLFPALEADIELGPIGPSRTQLSINARYRPPLGLVGRVADRTLLHRVAEATLQDFIRRVGDQIHATVPSVA